MKWKVAELKGKRRSLKLKEKLKENKGEETRKHKSMEKELGTEVSKWMEAMTHNGFEYFEYLLGSFGREEGHVSLCVSARVASLDGRWSAASTQCNAILSTNSAPLDVSLQIQIQIFAQQFFDAVRFRTVSVRVRLHIEESVMLWRGRGGRRFDEQFRNCCRCGLIEL